jgi:antirestriction protein ArdC
MGNSSRLFALAGLLRRNGRLLPEHTCFNRRFPDESRFEKNEEFYSVLYHELAHATGHQSRLGRKEVIEVNTFGSDAYGSEELVAELTSSMLCGFAGISNETIDLAASYLDGWLSVLKKDKRVIVTASAKAQAAADYILNVKGGDQDLSDVA